MAAISGVYAYESAEACPALQNLGIDALSKDFTRRYFAKLVATSRRPLKEFLLDQSRVAGVGNIYSAESLWHVTHEPVPPRRFPDHRGGAPPP
jgi:formamidopyrimidine-DNA glycosylase